ncbi:hypothetical protein KC19_1G231600 [Ceratodon purpureus]|uniref:Uncharacterized protein n=1 Tax=Ceratodon purpureus TaxID=3225 RepID=A0A8T0JB64_CERPU|nr:hypothetical protein KC19_1G231600 [Ceratodon purpureus]
MFCSWWNPLTKLLSPTCNLTKTRSLWTLAKKILNLEMLMRKKRRRSRMITLLMPLRKK